MEDIKLESWQALTIESLAERRNRVLQEGQKIIDGINAAMEHHAREWCGGQDGPFEFTPRPDGLYLVSKDDETGVAPAA